jgi:ABC-type antimicrobial peptide transport system permease subunit
MKKWDGRNIMKDKKKFNFNVFIYVYRGFSAKKFRHGLTVIGLTLSITFLILVLSMARGFTLEVESKVYNTIGEVDDSTKPGFDNPGKEATELDREVQKTIILWLIVTSVFIMIASTAIISNTMYLSVRERRKEIGILKAVGLTDMQVAKIFIIESIWLSVLAWLIALFSGTLLSGNVFNAIYIRGSSPLFFSPAKAMPEILLIAFMITIIVGALSALYPALKAARMDPVSAISPGE